MIKKIKLSKLVLDYSIYPRQHLDNYHVDELVEALKAGKRLPPITADKTTHKVSDGWHRVEATRKFVGEKAVIEVELKEYASDADMFQDAILLNASHGKPLSRMDETYCLAKAADFKLEQAVVASLLNITVERAEGLISTRLATSASGPIALKGSTAWLAGRKLSQEQEKYNRKAGGMPQTFYINQVIAMLEGDAVDWDNERVNSQLKRLLKLLEENLKAVA